MAKSEQKEKTQRQKKRIEALEQQVYQLRQSNLDLQQELMNIRKAALLNEILNKYPDMLNIQPANPKPNGQQQEQKREKNPGD